MTFTTQQIAALQAPLDRTHVATRSQSGRSLSYVEGWHVIAEANRIFGFGNWHRETVEMRQVSEHETMIGKDDARNKPGYHGWAVSYLSKVRITVWVGDGPKITREGYGNGHGIDRSLGLAHESAAKEAETDAMKRAFMTFGNPFGLALYDKSQSNVVDTPAPAAPPAVDVADFALRWPRMLELSDTGFALEKLKADSARELNAVKAADLAIFDNLVAAYKARQKVIQAAS
jgi:recombination DNA repair RAD52 pathway protein